MNKLPLAKRAQIVGLLVEGNSLRATSRLADVSINTVTKLLVDLGIACADYQDKTLRNLTCKCIQVDEIWAFCYVKKTNLKKAKAAPEGAGDVWTWTGIDADTKLAVSWYVGDRDTDAAREFIGDLASRLANRIQLTSDGHGAYLQAVEEAFQGEVDYAQLVKIYGKPPYEKGVERRYTPPECIGIKKRPMRGEPKFNQISTSYVERSNLTMRMGIRRFTRLTNAFSKKIENHAHAVALHFMWYNFGRVHKTLRVTPAMQAGVSDHIWALEEIAALAD